VREIREELPYVADGAELFGWFAAQPWSVFLDSGPPGARQGRYDILAADPTQTLVTWGGITEVRTRHGSRESAADPLDLLRQALGPRTKATSLPFCGGALGYLSYDLARRFDVFPEHAGEGPDMPDMAVGVYDWAVVVDHHERRSWFVRQGRDPATPLSWDAMVRGFSDAARPVRPEPLQARETLHSSMDREHYDHCFERLQRYIRDGDCYQVNLAIQFWSTVEGRPWPAYRHLREINPAPHGAFLSTPFGTILSCSPERFLSVADGEVETRPIKGTAPRSRDPSEDRRNAVELKFSPKNRAENLMIVDLLRNDLGRSCAVGSVEVPELFRLESYATVHHLVSTVRGRLAPGRDALDLVRACFPGGSITGAPKLRAMQIIDELEPHRRGVYCGAIGYLDFSGRMDTSIAIRTLVHTRGKLYFWSGGGIVADSDAAAEYGEIRDKAAGMLGILGVESETQPRQFTATGGAAQLDGWPPGVQTDPAMRSANESARIMDEQAAEDACVEAICNKGCLAVREDIAMLESGQLPPETEGLSDISRERVLNELKSIMAAYGDACRVD
jgi:para-aminobenzoate synthetase component 1